MCQLLSSLETQRIAFNECRQLEPFLGRVFFRMVASSRAFSRAGTLAESLAFRMSRSVARSTTFSRAHAVSCFHRSRAFALAELLGIWNAKHGCRPKSFFQICCRLVAFLACTEA